MYDCCPSADLLYVTLQAHVCVFASQMAVLFSCHAYFSFLVAGSGCMEWTGQLAYKSAGSNCTYLKCRSALSLLRLTVLWFFPKRNPPPLLALHEDVLAFCCWQLTGRPLQQCVPGIAHTQASFCMGAVDVLHSNDLAGHGVYIASALSVVLACNAGSPACCLLHGTLPLRLVCSFVCWEASVAVVHCALQAYARLCITTAWVWSTKAGCTESQLGLTNCSSTFFYLTATVGGLVCGLLWPSQLCCCSCLAQAGTAYMHY
jgi:hypothetical protein